ncbi:hypothetical protein [Chamaesiphon sp. VAR_48_metabat_403]|uniref:hypothetical protein n=1 Tax=Chamaesiphon sp. VAR_48_metabat_403 TaxID=2964700 RepID=UPI00286E6A3E|nr:hypothetical protein [Chamaesiphon sp. VAR_48_metabat_403]
MTQAYNSGGNNRFSVERMVATRWQNLIVGSLGFWLSGSLILDLVIMPTLWMTGMMEGSGFASASYSIFWIFNRVELLCAAAALSCVWASSQVSKLDRQTEMFVGAGMLLAIAMSYTFILTPYMSGLGIDLDIFATTKSIPVEMNQLHSIYWVLEASKLGIAGMLLAWSMKAE